MKRILMIGTGGTIASGQTGSGLAPALSVRQLLEELPELSERCHLDCIQLLSLDSTNIAPRHWLRMANVIRRHYADYDGFVLCHGTDTMAYTAAGLSYLIQGSAKPIILTGAQKPLHADSTDSRVNLSDSLLCACAGIPGVSIVFHGKVILGTRARKTRSKSNQAFSSINYPDLAVVQNGRLLRYITPESRPEPLFYSRLDTNVGLIKLIPGIDTQQLAWLLKRRDALVVESFGVGGLPSYDGNRFFRLVTSAVERGKVVVMTTQVQNEGSDLTVYSVGNRLKTSAGVLEAYDMTTEAVVAKLMWILGQTRDRDKIARLFYTPVGRDLLFEI